MSSKYRTTVINDRNNSREVYYSEDLRSAMWKASEFSSQDEQVLVDEVVQDACGDYLLVYKVMEYVQEAA